MFWLLAQAEAPSLLQRLFDLPAPFNMVVIIIAIIFGFMMIAAIAAEIRKYLSHQQEVAFKRELVDKGLSAEEIEKIVSAHRPEEPDDDD